MFRKGFVFAAAAGAVPVLACAVSLFAQTNTAPKPAARSAAAARRVERGKYLVNIMSCSDCHTPFKMGPNGPEPDMTRYLSGHPEGMKLPPPPAPSGPWIASFVDTNTAYAGPWGISYAINLTSDKNTGLGAGVWSEEVFIKAMRNGKHFGASRPIQPPMPWFWIGKATDEDLKSMFAFLQTVPPIVNHVPDWQEPPASSRPGAPAQPKPAKK
jgi:hypothetical protein